MEVKINARLINKLDTTFTLSLHQSSPERQELTLGNVTVYFKLDAQEESFNFLVLLQDRSKPTSNHTIRACRLSSEKAKIKQKKFICDESLWRILFHEFHDAFIPYSFDLTVESEIIVMDNPFTVLYDDTDMTDFELCAEDGSVKCHSAVLATASLTLRHMLMGKWSETESRTLLVKDTTQTTLQHLKDYMYTSKLPESGVEQLLLLASYYMMTDLENKCIEKLLCRVTTESSTELARFALNNNLMKLYFAYLELVRDGIIDVASLQEKEMQSESMILDP